ncbi:PREDICTED: ATP-dependent RNA helicase DEAH11, chloroplastic-like [Ipomoea nil]|uniref:ATP-dependent RNA helicase DEAH11, chloroplastic-like n=1 Tax=Ipomoea nil TaxID=35883 RepID=UPI00090169F8|nr:PREDICTED: ATP-dependent RNA helicase DEAH11, chloroplastic-like [Ipomoea nil]
MSSFAPGSYYQQQRTPRRDAPPEPSPSTKPASFVINLGSSKQKLTDLELYQVVRKLPKQPQSYSLCDSGGCAATLCYERWSETLEVMEHLWRTRLAGKLLFSPVLIRNVDLPSDKVELENRLKPVFYQRVRELIDGELVKNSRKKLTEVMAEANAVSVQLRKLKSLALLKKKEALLAELELIRERTEEFRQGIRCVKCHLKPPCPEDIDDSEETVLKLEGDFNWDRLHSLMMRECKRLKDGLPIYSFRHQILREIRRHQVTVLTGETGSGKSTQLVQFLADSGIGGNGAIVCTQPRKLAAVSLANRVKLECVGCYEDDSIICHPSYSSSSRFDAGTIIFMTDHCLLQHYMSDNDLSKISCIIVDEAHERSLNTDLLLALMKGLLLRRPDMRLIVMSATADADQLSKYFVGCGTFHVIGRSFPVVIKYVPFESEGCSGVVAPYVSNVVKMVRDIYNTRRDGAILAFLTSQMEVEWACENLRLPSTIALPLHGKLSNQDQHKIFLDFPGMRKVIFATNVAETSLTIPGVKYVVDSGLVKEKRFEPGSGMNVLRVCKTSQSSANQRAGRAGRTEPGRCYRLFSETDFQTMPCHQEPEIRKVHLGIALLRILAFGIKDVQSFDFIDAPSPKAIETTIQSLIQLGAIAQIDDGYELTAEGQRIVKLGIEPRLGKMLLDCFQHELGKEGLALAAVIANYSTIFCRVGTEEEKLKSDRYKVQFCHPFGDLFTLLSVYKEWEAVPLQKRSGWCWDNSVNAKTMRRCRETVQELEACLRQELRIDTPSIWLWNPQVQSEHDDTLKRIILASLSENVAMYSGYDQLGYEVALTGKHFQLHPSCSLLSFCQRPTWIVFSEVLVAAKEYLVCATAFDFSSLATLQPAPSFDFSKMDARRLQKKVLTGFGSLLMKKFCGRSNCSLNHLVSQIRLSCMDERIGIEVRGDRNEIIVFASFGDMERVLAAVNGALEHERKLLRNECLEKCLHNGGPGSSSASIALFGAGAEIKHLELEKRCLTIDIFHSIGNAVDDKELVMFLERNCGDICTIFKFSGIRQEREEMEKWGRVTFLTPEAANLATALNLVKFNGGLLKFVPSKGGDKMFSSPFLRAKVYWPRRASRGKAILKCNPNDVSLVADDLSYLEIGGKFVWCEPSTWSSDRVVITGIDKDISETEISEAINELTERKILSLFIVRGTPVENPPLLACEEALLREISSLMPKRIHLSAQVFQPEPKDNYMRAVITFDGNHHLEAAKALEELDGKVLLGFLQWQKIKCQQIFQSTVSCPAAAYHAIQTELEALLERLKNHEGVDCRLERNNNGPYRVKISANATKTVVEVRKRLEELMKGKVMEHEGVTPTVLQLLFSREGIDLMRSIQLETGTYIMFDRHNLVVRMFGSSNKVDLAQQKFVGSLLALHESKQLVVRLRGEGLPPDMMKRVVDTFGPDLKGLKQMFPGGEFYLNTRHHCVRVKGGTTKDLCQRVENTIYEIARASGSHVQRNDNEASCPICLCEFEERYVLESCLHAFCRSCLLEQCESAIRSSDGFPLRCLHNGCNAPILIPDIKSLLPVEKLDELFRASVSAFVASNTSYRFCPSPDCPSVYHITDSDSLAFMCGVCYAETCTRCHQEYHPFLSCEKYKEFKDDPDSSLKEWAEGRENVKACPVCKCTIEKVDGCNHIECRCGKHVCWVCLEFYETSDECYNHLRSVHLGIHNLIHG